MQTLEVPLPSQIFGKGSDKSLFVFIALRRFSLFNIYGCLATGSGAPVGSGVPVGPGESTDSGVPVVSGRTSTVATCK